MTGRAIINSSLGALILSGCSRPEQEPPPIQQPPPPEASEPPAPDFAVALWPGEGIPEFDAVGLPLVLRTAATPSAPIRDTLRPAPGDRIRYDSTRHVTIRAARIAVLRADTIAGRDFGDAAWLSREAYQSTVPAIEVAVAPESRVDLLQHRAEGACFVRIGERVIEASPCPLFDVGGFRPSGEPVTAWWIFVPGGADGGGWVEVTDSTVRLAGRRF